MPPALEDWPRKNYQPGGGNPFLSYAVFGLIKQPLALSASKYRSNGLPNGAEISSYNKISHPDFFSLFISDAHLKPLFAEDPALANTIKTQGHCVVLQGELPDQSTLNYLRDAVGLLTCLLDQGGEAIFDVQTFKWWTPANWRREIFDHRQSYPRHHVEILVTPEDNGTEWFHTRGMRKFGRPDISVRHVSNQYRDAIIDLNNRFIEMQAFGAVIPEGQEIRMAKLPSGMKCHHWGAVEDLAFNNVHLEIAWPEG